MHRRDLHRIDPQPVAAPRKSAWLSFLPAQLAEATRENSSGP